MIPHNELQSHYLTKSRRVSRRRGVFLGPSQKDKTTMPFIRLGGDVGYEYPMALRLGPPLRAFLFNSKFYRVFAD